MKFASKSITKLQVYADEIIDINCMFTNAKDNDRIWFGKKARIIKNLNSLCQDAYYFIKSLMLLDVLLKAQVPRKEIMWWCQLLFHLKTMYMSNPPLAAEKSLKIFPKHILEIPNLKANKRASR